MDSIGRCEVGSWLRDVLRDATSFTRVAHLEVKDLSAFLAAPPGPLALGSASGTMARVGEKVRSHKSATIGS